MALEGEGSDKQFCFISQLVRQKNKAIIVSKCKKYLFGNKTKKALHSTVPLSLLENY